MEQNVDAGVPVMPTVENKQKNGNGFKLATIIACIVEELKNSVVDTDDITTETDSTNIVIDDWGLKIKIPESVSIVSYTMDNDTWLSITGAPADNEQKTATVGLVKVDKTAVESGNAQWTSLDEAVFLDDDSAYYLMYTNTTPERDLTIDKQIIDALSDSTLYSKI